MRAPEQVWNVHIDAWNSSTPPVGEEDLAGAGSSRRRMSEARAKRGKGGVVPDRKLVPQHDVLRNEREEQKQHPASVCASMDCGAMMAVTNPVARRRESADRQAGDQHRQA